MKNPFRRKPPMPSNRYVLGEEVIHPGKYVSIPPIRPFSHFRRVEQWKGKRHRQHHQTRGHHGR